METALLLLILYALFSPRILQKFYNTLLFYPDKEQEGLYNIGNIADTTKEDCFFTSDGGRRLHAWYFKNPHSDKLILISHGNAGNLSHRAWLAKLLLEAGASVFIYDYQGYGRSEGKPSINGIINDGLAAYDFTTEKLGYKPEQIIIFGESLGSGVACNLAQERKSAGLILQSPFCSLRKIACEKLPWLVLYPDPLMVTDLDNLSRLKAYGQPVLIIHGKRDRTVPFKHSETLYAIAGERKHFVVLDNCGHNDIYDHDPPSYTQTIKDFLLTMEQMN